MAHPTCSLITRPVNTNTSVVPKMLSLKLIKPLTSITTGSTQYLNTVPLNSLLNKPGPSRIQSQTETHESYSVTVPITSSTQHMSTIVPSIIDSDDEKKNSIALKKNDHFIWDHNMIMLFFTKYEHHEKKFKNKKYQSKEAMFEALAESFKKRGYVNATKNAMKNKFKLLKKKWNKYIKQTMGKNSTGRGRKPLPYENEMIRIFGGSHSAMPLFVAGRNECVSQEEILQKVNQLSENENNEQFSIASSSPLSTLSLINSESESITNSSRSSMISNSCSLLTKTKVRDGKLALILQSVKESICAVLQKESDEKQEARIKYLTELQKCNELQKERNNILQKQLKTLEEIANKIYPIQKKDELSEEELSD